MIDEKKIEEAAKKYANNAKGDYIAISNAEEGFKAGVEWYMNAMLDEVHDFFK